MSDEKTIEPTGWVFYLDETQLPIVQNAIIEAMRKNGISTAMIAYKPKAQTEALVSICRQYISDNSVEVNGTIAYSGDLIISPLHSGDEMVARVVSAIKLEDAGSTGGWKGKYENPELFLHYFGNNARVVRQPK